MTYLFHVLMCSTFGDVMVNTQDSGMAVLPCVQVRTSSKLFSQSTGHFPSTLSCLQLRTSLWKDIVRVCNLQFLDVIDYCFVFRKGA